MSAEPQEFKDWGWSCPVCLKDFSQHQAECPNCGFQEGPDDSKVTELRNEYLKMRQQRQKVDEFKEKIAIALAVVGLLIVMIYVLMQK
ncbi:MAG: hypothetical protein O3C46_02045 [Bacteroidetes bacterium]|jgi:uncharacterized membrane protein YvbJ|nr:hypothetical protein [Bacteroidota bacterium]MDA0931441.1 hypothetical protein [Bacteroidota bacterium]